MNKDFVIVLCACERDHTLDIEDILEDYLGSLNVRIEEYTFEDCENEFDMYLDVENMFKVIGDSNIVIIDDNKFYVRPGEQINWQSLEQFRGIVNHIKEHKGYPNLCTKVYGLDISHIEERNMRRAPYFYDNDLKDELKSLAIEIKRELKI